MYSQNAEESFILAYFDGRVGRFLDCGAYDGKSMSNTFALAERGWSGVCVEPEPRSLEGLHLTHGDNPKIVIEPVAIASEAGMLPFHSSNGGGVSTLNDFHRDKWSAVTTFDTIMVRAITPKMLMDSNPGKFEFFSLDVEGESADLFELFDLTGMGTELVCVEHDGQERRVEEHCRKHGLTNLLYRNGENLIIGR